MNVKDFLAGTSGFLWGGIPILVGAVAVAGIINGSVWVGSQLYPLFLVISIITFGLVIFISLPLSIPKATRRFSSKTLVVSSYVFGITLWVKGLLLTYFLWGSLAVLIGLFAGGVGVIPMAMLATGFDGQWEHFIELVLLIIMTFATRIGGGLLAESLESLG